MRQQLSAHTAAVTASVSARQASSKGDALTSERVGVKARRRRLTRTVRERVWAIYLPMDVGMLEPCATMLSCPRCAQTHPVGAK